MKRNLFKVSLFLIGMAAWAQMASAQGIVVNKTDGTKVYFKASEVQSVGVYGYGEEPEPQPQPGEGQTVTVNGVSFQMIAVEGGTFQMGSNSGSDNDEKPVHEVRLNSFSIGQTEVTQDLWKAVMGTNPSNFKGNKKPVEKVSWNDCQTFIQKLNQLTGKQFRLPTEAEWEFAARGGTQSKGYTYSGSNSLSDVAWYVVNSFEKGEDSPDYGTHVVGTKSPNELDIYDMTGNVSEWCQDWYGSDYYASSVVNNPQGPSSGDSHVIRGGSWRKVASGCHVSRRDYGYTGSDDYLGFRLAQ
ncbi:MAG: SUMF1/EgtB/PvdO family nonheme iron enzyme [Bacteroidaceae bacterium]|nr:SUMF1/EgtB/PvdO family nonheme iron enzyme [Bacteroidaceae bacterium]